MKELLTKLLDKIEKLHLDKQKIIAVLAVTALLAVFDVIFIVSAQIKAIKDVSVKVSGLNQDIRELVNNVTAMKQGQARPKIAQKVKQIISESDLPSLVQDIDASAKKNNIRIIQIKPGWNTGGAKSPIGDFKPVSILLELVSTYHTFGGFINDLENAQKFIGIEQMDITPLGGDFLKQKVTLLLRTYVK